MFNQLKLKNTNKIIINENMVIFYTKNFTACLDFVWIGDTSLSWKVLSISTQIVEHNNTLKF